MLKKLWKTELEFWYLTFIEKKWLSPRQFSKGWLNKKIFRFITLQLIFALFFNLAFILGQLVANRRANIRQYTPSASNFVLRIFGGNKPLKSLFSIFIIHLNSYLKQEKHVWAILVAYDSSGKHKESIKYAMNRRWAHSCINLITAVRCHSCPLWQRILQFTFLENKSARIIHIRLLIHLKSIYGQKVKEIDFSTLATECWILPYRRF